MQSISNKIAYHVETEQFTFVSNYNQMKVIPAPHKQGLRFFGIGSK
jgi:hypothetical protein